MAARKTSRSASAKSTNEKPNVRLARISRSAIAAKPQIAGTCFVVMPIGPQKRSDGTIVSQQELRARFDHIIRDAIAEAAPQLEVTRGDDVSRPGSITADIYTRLMHSDYVVADISFANPNVFYELGIRHACRTGTVLIRAEDEPQAPFDVRTARHVPYSTGPGGWKKLAVDLREQFEWIASHPRDLDNEFLSQAKLIGFQYPTFGQRAVEKQREFAEAMGKVMAAPGVGELMLGAIRGNGINSEALMERMLASPEAVLAILQLIVSNGGKFEPPF